jgi:hypothetical protein
LQAADSGNNIFTSLEGLDTKWTIDETHLRTINPEEAKIVLNSTSSVIIQGSKVGRAWATVSINNRYQDKVDLVVVEPIALFPNPVVRTFPHHHIPFKLCATKGAYEDGERKCARRISLPNGNYTVTTANHTCLTADPSGYASTHEEGTSAISVIDQVVSDNHASVLVIVGWPAHVDQPAQYIPLGDDPVFNPAFYDKDGSRIDLFEPIDWQIDGEWKTVGTKNIILSYFDFAFTAVVIVCPPILVDPPSVVLPVGYDGYVIKALGGSGNYSIRLETPNVVQYSNSRVKAIAEGTARILVKDRLIAK